MKGSPFLDRGPGKGSKLVPDVAIRGIHEQLYSYLVWSLNRDEYLNSRSGCLLAGNVA
jgi:hypothetical protein